MKSKRKPTVIIEIETFLPRPLKTNPERYTQKRYRTWMSLGPWPVLYHDHTIIIVRQFGSVSLYQPNGHFQSAGYDMRHPKAGLIPRTHCSWRINPESIKKLRQKRS